MRNHAVGVSVCAERNFIGRKPTSLRSTSFARSATSFICAARGGNDISLRLNDVACKHANDVVPCGTNEKILKAMLSGFFVFGDRNRCHQFLYSKYSAEYATTILPVFFSVTTIIVSPRCVVLYTPKSCRRSLSSQL